jgi:quercetin dioxygenase-like cupin family protein
MPPLESAECAAMAKRAADLVDVATLPRTGTAESFVLWQDEESVAWLNVVPEHRDTGYHDHDGSAVGVYVLEGSVTNEGLPIGAPRRARRYGPGDSFHVPGSGIHRMYHDTGALTIHVYSPPLRAIGYYEVVNGLLQRTPGPPDEASPESPQLLASLTDR